MDTNTPISEVTPGAPETPVAATSNPGTKITSEAPIDSVFELPSNVHSRCPSCSDHFCQKLGILLLLILAVAVCFTVGAILMWLSTTRHTCSDWEYNGYETYTCNYAYADIYRHCNTTCACVSLSFATTCLEYPSGVSPGFVIGGLIVVFVGVVILVFGIYKLV